MNARPRRWRQIVLKLVQHARWVLPGAGSPWADAMRHELDYIADDPAALRWAIGCVLASYRVRVTGLRCGGARTCLRHFAACGCLMLLAGLALQGHARGQTEQPRPAFVETTCDLPNVSPSIRPQLRCGEVSVPRDYDNPGAGQFKLAVVVIHTVTKEQQADPVLFIHGGPGSPLTAQAARIAGAESTILAPDRDLILVDQRGAGRSEPALCPDLAKRQLTAFAQGGSTDVVMTAWRGTYMDCRRNLVQQGIDPAWFGTSVTVRDIEVLRQALGISRWNVYARSYGTTVAMTMMARHPETLRAVDLDSIYPPDPAPLTHAQTFDTALNALFEACCADSACVAAHPDLAATFHEAMAGLANAPLTVVLPPGLGPADVALGPLLFRGIVNQALYYRPLLSMLPNVIQSAHDRDPAALQPLIGHLARQFLAQSTGDRMVVECRDRPSLQAESAVVASTVIPGIIDFHGVRRNWVKPGSPPVVASSNVVPSLLLTGAIDPITPPPFARIVVARMGPAAPVVEFPHVGHDVEESSACGANLVTQFVRRPEGPLSTACVAAVPPVTLS
ncbi:MAG TPA: alpha/beta fold hydrolase [Acetobacteraceae bacterium]|jgi:pimeloyl-ACP methyl ester carboxylesterase|nr:alpha/beta fold hydrolase [Acetobacteraceae bacterium]